MSLRTNYCGELSAEHVGQTVTVAGWVDTRRVHSEHLAFVDVRDHTGIVQVVVDQKVDVRSEYVVAITGTVAARPADMVNEKLASGAIEIRDTEVTILNEAEPPPFPMHDRTEVSEEIRLEHRYVDLRREKMQRNLRARAKINSAIRGAMERQGFCELETPMLIASTPEGARDFVVPSRMHPGNFYALPQSPQLFKQLSMVGGLDRYYQIARCLRDEDLRADRQFEFMQLDAEASFVDQEDVFTFISEAVADATEAITGERPTDFPRMTYADAMDRYGSDKPDVRFGMELTELTDLFADTESNVFKTPAVKGICMPGGADELGRNKIDELTDKAKQWGAKGLAWFRMKEGGLEGGLTKFMSESELAGVVERLDAKTGDMVFLIADDKRVANKVLGLLRLELGKPPINDGSFSFLWITDFPMFEAVVDGNPVPAHHPFTMPHEDDVEMMSTAEGDEWLDIRSQAYDLTLNGWELGSGSIRIFQKDLQSRIFDILGIGEDEQMAKFGFLLNAFKYGAPPHGGFAFGIDRLTALLVGEENIREVICVPEDPEGLRPAHERAEPSGSCPPRRARAASSPSRGLASGAIQTGLH